MFADRHFHRTGRWHKKSTLPSGDTTPPTITIGPTVHSITETQALVEWTQDEAGTGLVGWGLTAGGPRAIDYTYQSSFEGSYATYHNMTMGNLSPTTTYHFMVESSDAAGNLVTSAGTFETLTSGTNDTVGYPTSQVGKTYVPWGGSLSEPALGSYVQDPNFEGRIYCIHNSDRAIYPKKPAWNLSMTKLLLNRDGGAIVNGQPPFAYIGTDSGVSSNFVWSATDPNSGLQTRNVGDPAQGILYRHTPLSGSPTLLRNFGTAKYHLSAEGRQSINDRYIALKRGDERGMLFYDVVADTIMGTAAFNGDIDWVTTAPSGAYALVRFDAAGTGSQQGTWLYSQSCAPIRNINSGSHGDVARDENGNDIYVGFDGGGYSAWRLNTTSKTVILGNVIGGHISGVMHSRLGWVLISNHYQSANEPGWDQILAVKTDGSNTVQPFCHARTIQSSSAYSYALSTHATPSPDGRMVTWGGAWQRWTTGNNTPRGYLALVPA